MTANIDWYLYYEVCETEEELIAAANELVGGLA